MKCYSETMKNWSFDINKLILKQIKDYFPNYTFKQTTLEHDLLFHADLIVRLPNGEVEYWLMRFRNPPYKDFLLRVRACRHKSEFRKIYEGLTSSKRYLHVILDSQRRVKEVYVINLKRLSSNKQFLDYVYRYQNKGEFVYITPQQLFKQNVVDIYINVNELE